MSPQFLRLSFKRKLLHLFSRSCGKRFHLSGTIQPTTFCEVSRIRSRKSVFQGRLSRAHSVRFTHTFGASFIHSQVSTLETLPRIRTLDTFVLSKSHCFVSHWTLLGVLRLDTWGNSILSIHWVFVLALYVLIVGLKTSDTMNTIDQLNTTQPKLTLAIAMKIARERNCTLRKLDGEFRVNLKGGTEEQAYHTGDLQDAIDTLCRFTAKN